MLSQQLIDATSNLVKHLSRHEPRAFGGDMSDLAALLGTRMEEKGPLRSTPDQDREMLRIAARHLMLYLACHSPDAMIDILAKAA